MKPNMGNTDRIIRGIAGFILALVGLFAVPASSVVLQIILVLVGIILLVTAATRFCPIYALLKLNTLKR